jgi:hypothetical protein
MGIEWLGNKFMGFIDKEIEKRAHAAGKAMVAVAKSLVPIDTSYLHDHIYYTYLPNKRLLTLHADSYYAYFVEAGTFKMAPRPYLRPALAVAGPAFLSGVSTQVMAGTSLPTNYTPRQILPHIKPHIAAANKKFNRGIVKRTTATAVHMDRANEAMRSGGKVITSKIQKLHTRRKAW